MGPPRGVYMIPTLPPSISDDEKNQFYATLAGNLSDQSSIHVHWHTHRQNPSVCWICDMNTLLSMAFNTKSSLDMVTKSSSDDESDTEIESEFLNKNEEPNEPEYETEEEEPVGDSQ